MEKLEFPGGMSSPSWVSCRIFSAGFGARRVNEHSNGTWTRNEDVFPVEDGDVPASYVSLLKFPVFLPETWLEKKQWARKTEDHQRFWFDRLCVYQGHQHQVLKAETITAIPAFIAQSKGLLVLWDDTRRFFLGGAGQR